MKIGWCYKIPNEIPFLTILKFAGTFKMDGILTGAGRIRHAYAVGHNHDPDRIFADMKKRLCPKPNSNTGLKAKR